MQCYGREAGYSNEPVSGSHKYEVCVWGKTDSGQAKMELPSLSALLSIKGIGITSLNDLNEAYKVLNEGLSVVYIGKTENSPIEYGVCIHVQRSSKGDTSGSQFIFQMVSGRLTYIREGYSNGDAILYTNWRQI